MQSLIHSTSTYWRQKISFLSDYCSVLIRCKPNGSLTRFFCSFLSAKQRPTNRLGVQEARQQKGVGVFCPTETKAFSSLFIPITTHSLSHLILEREGEVRSQGVSAGHPSLRGYTCRN